MEPLSLTVTRVFQKRMKKLFGLKGKAIELRCIKLHKKLHSSHVAHMAEVGNVQNVVEKPERKRPLTDMYRAFNGMRTGRRNRRMWRKTTPRHLVRHKSHITWFGIEHKLPRWEASD
jgi:hypothetical protein